MEVTALRLWTRRRGWSCTRVTSHGTRHGNRLFPRPRHSDQECPIDETPDCVCIHPPPVATATPTTGPAPAPSYDRTGAFISSAACHRTSTRAAMKPPGASPRLRCSGTGARGGRAYAWTHARRDAHHEGLAPQHGNDVHVRPCLGGETCGKPRGPLTRSSERLDCRELKSTSRLPPPAIYQHRL